MEYAKTKESTGNCYGLVYHPTENTMSICYRGNVGDTVIQPEDFTEAQIKACEGLLTAFGVDEGFGTAVALKADLRDSIALKKVVPEKEKI